MTGRELLVLRALIEQARLLRSLLAALGRIDPVLGAWLVTTAKLGTTPDALGVLVSQTMAEAEALLPPETEP